MDKTLENIAGRECELYFCGQPQALLVQPVSQHQRDGMAEELATIGDAGVPFALATVPIADWELELMPWAEPAVSKRPEVGSGAEATLDYISNGLVPWLTGRCGALPVVLGGYSLGGLFALWAARRTPLFHAVAAASPSLWAGDWPAYAECHPLQARKAYLSLGDREERTRNQAMARCGDRVRNEYARLQAELGAEATTLVWEQGGHFANPAARMGRAFAWCL